MMHARAVRGLQRGVEQHSFHWTYFHEISCLGVIRISVEKIQVSINPDKNNVYFIWRPVYIHDNISVNYSQMRNVSNKICRENQNTHFVFSDVFPKILFFR